MSLSGTGKLFLCSGNMRLSGLSNSQQKSRSSTPNSLASLSPGEVEDNSSVPVPFDTANGSNNTEIGQDFHPRHRYGRLAMREKRTTTTSSSLSSTSYSLFGAAPSLFQRPTVRTAAAASHVQMYQIPGYEIPGYEIVNDVVHDGRCGIHAVNLALELYTEDESRDDIMAATRKKMVELRASFLLLQSNIFKYKELKHKAREMRYDSEFYQPETSSELYSTVFYDSRSLLLQISELFSKLFHHPLCLKSYIEKECAQILSAENHGIKEETVANITNGLGKCTREIDASVKEGRGFSFSNETWDFIVNRNFYVNIDTFKQNSIESDKAWIEFDDIKAFMLFSGYLLKGDAEKVEIRDGYKYTFSSFEYFDSSQQKTKSVTFVNIALLGKDDSTPPSVTRRLSSKTKDESNRYDDDSPESFCSTLTSSDSMSSNWNPSSSPPSSASNSPNMSSTSQVNNISPDSEPDKLRPGGKALSAPHTLLARSTYFSQSSSSSVVAPSVTGASGVHWVFVKPNKV